MKKDMFVYFIAPVGGGHIKIGCSHDPVGRMRQIENLSPPLELLACAIGTFHDERKIHAAFLQHWSGLSEWFRPAPEILALIEELQRTGTLPAAMRGGPDTKIPFPVKRRADDARFGRRAPHICEAMSAGVRAALVRREQARRVAQ